MALIAIVGATNANSYVTVLEAGTYLWSSVPRGKQRPWQEATVEEKETMLITATRLIDRMVSWHSISADTDQALAWPMSNAKTRKGSPIDNDVIPDDIKNATTEYALALLETQGTFSGGIADLASFTDGNVSMTFRDSAPTSPTEKMPKNVRQYLRHYGFIAGDTVIGIVRV